jgi:hypothetical protein
MIELWILPTERIIRNSGWKGKDISPKAECWNYPKFRHMTSRPVYADTSFLAYRGTSMKYEMLKRSPFIMLLPMEVHVNFNHLSYSLVILMD